MKTENIKALKEWTTVVKALGEGKQTILIRKRSVKFWAVDLLFIVWFKGNVYPITPHGIILESGMRACPLHKLTLLLLFNSNE